MKRDCTSLKLEWVEHMLENIKKSGKWAPCPYDQLLELNRGSYREMFVDSEVQTINLCVNKVYVSQDNLVTCFSTNQGSGLGWVRLDRSSKCFGWMENLMGHFVGEAAKVFWKSNRDLVKRFKPKARFGSTQPAVKNGVIGASPGFHWYVSSQQKPFCDSPKLEISKVSVSDSQNISF